MKKNFKIVQSILILSFLLLVHNISAAPTSIKNNYTMNQPYSSKIIQSDNSNKTSQLQLAPSFYCKNNNTCIRSQPNTDSKVLGILYYGDIVNVDTNDCYTGSFIKIHYKGNIGYVYDAHLASSE
ncbi:SH3 domain-containing protein [Clostridium sp. WILCCON 0269]|uniref:SH3 domain-containing protein n=1 Tax=Candidatus Clostridium eludens TaxID=3381663 RepID=A0ABW8SNT6_9CLOT